MEVRRVHRQRQHREGQAVSCDYCAETMLEPLLDHFSAGCPSCSARAIAVVGDRQALLSDPLPDTQAQVLERIFGAAWRDHVQAVRDWISAIRQAEARV